MIVLQEQDGEKEVALSMDVPHMNNEHVECQHVKHLAYLPLSITPVANKLVSNKISAIINIRLNTPNIFANAHCLHKSSNSLVEVNL